LGNIIVGLMVLPEMTLSVGGEKGERRLKGALEILRRGKSEQ